MDNNGNGKIKKLLINKTTFRILLGSIVLSSLVSSCETLETKPLLEISEGTYDSIKNGQADLFKQKLYYFDKSNNSTGLVNLLELPKVDVSINKGNLRKIKSLDIDVLSSKISDLKHMPNIENLTLSNFEYLTNQDKEIINSLNKLKNITFNLNTDYINVKMDIDISWIKKGITINISSKRLKINEDLKDLYTYKLLNNLSEKYKDKINFNFFDEERLKNLIRWDAQLTEIVKSFKFNENTSDIDKIIQIVCYVTDRIDYDPDVSKLIQNSIGIVESENITEYNNRLLELVLDDNDNYGICCNYAALTTMLGHYSGIEMDYVSGIYGDSDNGHAWCLYNKDGENVIIDPTFLDDNVIFNIQKTNYYTTNKYQDLTDSIYRDYMIDTIFSHDTNYKTILVRDYVDNNNHTNQYNKKSTSYINTEKDRYFNEVILKEVKTKLAISLITMLILVSEVTISTAKKKKENSKKKLIKRLNNTNE